MNGKIAAGRMRPADTSANEKVGGAGRLPLRAREVTVCNNLLVGVISGARKEMFDVAQNEAHGFPVKPA